MPQTQQEHRRPSSRPDGGSPDPCRPGHCSRLEGTGSAASRAGRHPADSAPTRQYRLCTTSHSTSGPATQLLIPRLIPEIMGSHFYLPLQATEGNVTT